VAAVAVVFATVNLPGSNNDGLTWTGAVHGRDGAGAGSGAAHGRRDPLAAGAFARAGEDDAKAVVVGLQANMWDPEALLQEATGSATTRCSCTSSPASPALRPAVLLINGDSHVSAAIARLRTRAAPRARSTAPPRCRT